MFCIKLASCRSGSWKAWRTPSALCTRVPSLFATFSANCLSAMMCLSMTLESLNSRFYSQTQCGSCASPLTSPLSTLSRRHSRPTSQKNTPLPQKLLMGLSLEWTRRNSWTPAHYPHQNPSRSSVFSTPNSPHWSWTACLTLSFLACFRTPCFSSDTSENTRRKSDAKTLRPTISGWLLSFSGTLSKNLLCSHSETC